MTKWKDDVMFFCVGVFVALIGVHVFDEYHPNDNQCITKENVVRLVCDCTGDSELEDEGYQDNYFSPEDYE
jgi:hypothetical protein